MKPPQRRRTAPARYLDEATGPPAWSPREKRLLLRLLQARRDQPEPDAAELARELPGRSEAEIRDFIQQLKGRVVREAIRRLYPGGSQGPRHRETQTPAPIEVWTDLAEKITGPLEAPLTAAFSQVLTIAAVEPLSLLHSKPPKPTQARGKPLHLSTTRGQEDPTPGAPSPAPGSSGPIPGAPGPVPETFGSTSETLGAAPGASTSSGVPGPTPGAPDPAPETSGPTPEASGPAPKITGHTPEASSPAPKMPSPAPEAPMASLAEGDFTVDFEKIYKYLSCCCRGGQGPELSAAEAAVVLDLLLALPEELPRLPCTALAEHMLQTHTRLTAPQPRPPAASPRPGAEDGGTGSKGPEEPGQATPQAPKSKELRPAWQAAGICPLNPFLVPLELLGQVATPAR